MEELKALGRAHRKAGLGNCLPAGHLATFCAQLDHFHIPAGQSPDRFLDGQVGWIFHAQDQGVVVQFDRQGAVVAEFDVAPGETRVVTIEE